MDKRRPSTHPNPRENRLLGLLPQREYGRLVARMEPVAIPLREVVYRADQPIEFVYFPRSGVMSLVLSMEDGAAVEIGMVGQEGFVGVPVFLGTDRSPTQVICQGAGTALRMGAAAFRDEVQRPGPLQAAVMRYTQYRLGMVGQGMACNRLHSIGQRCARWLLAMHDRVGQDELPVTQEFLALMLGVRRASVTVAAGTLQKAGLIDYHRGRIRITDRGGLEEAACECHRRIRDELDRLLR